jgi:hypothetical protein
MAFSSRVIATALLLSASVLSLPSIAQEATGKPLANGYHRSGQVIAEVSGAVRDGKQLTVKVRFKPAAEGQNVSATLYGQLTEQNYQNDYYLVAGDKKYLLLKDSEGKPLAPSSVALTGKGPVVGVWHGVFPAPPADQKVTLFIQGVEPLGPFAVPAE